MHGHHVGKKQHNHVDGALSGVVTRVRIQVPNGDASRLCLLCIHISNESAKRRSVATNLLLVIRELLATEVDNMSWAPCSFLLKKVARA